MKKYIQFKKQRELGDIITDTFAFLRQEFKPFLSTIFKVSGIYLILFLLSMAFYLYTVGDIFDFTNTYSADYADDIDFVGMISAVLAVAVFGILSYVSAEATALHYIKLYIKNNGEVNQDEVKTNVNKSLMPFIGLGLLKWVTIFVAAMFCLLPMFYVIVPMAVAFSIYTFEERSATDSFSYSFSFIRDDYWITLATIIVMGIIVTVAGYAFGLPAGIYSMVKMGIFSGEMDPANMNTFTDPVYVVLNLINYLFNFILNLISIVAGAFIYFNINERRNFTGTLEQIDELGRSNH
ncbi:hypothetical protein [Lacinutrix undariae]